MRKTQLALAIATLGAISSAHATNGMNLEGYGPIAAAMGGASMAYDNGTAAVMNNPATLGLMRDGSRLDVAVGMLGPDVSMTSGGGPVSSSGGDSYFMPAIGWIKKTGSMAYGLAVFAQGGMGTEWDDAIFTANYSPDGQAQRSELGVGRLIAPLSYQVTPDLTVGGSLDLVWAMMDLKMALPGVYFNNAPGGLVTGNSAGFAGTLGLITGGWTGAPGGLTFGRLDASDGSDYTGKAKATGFAGKLGFVYQASSTVTIGGSYHSKTSLNDMETGASSAVFSADINGDAMADATMSGKLTIRDFQWPETYGLGVAVQATPALMVVADVKHIGWKDVMNSFNMTFSAGGEFVNFSMPQSWDDQTVFQLGVSYKATGALTLRAGASLSDNPIPDSTMNFLFPAIEKNHYTIGFGYEFAKGSDLNFSLQHAPKVTQTNSSGLAPVTVSHSQTSWQLMYSKLF